MSDRPVYIGDADGHLQVSRGGEARIDSGGLLRINHKPCNIARGRHTTVTAEDTIATGLARVESVVVSFETDPADANNIVSATIGDQAGAPAAGSIVIKTWKHDGSDPTPVAASAFSKVVNWIAIGS